MGESSTAEAIVRFTKGRVKGMQETGIKNASSFCQDSERTAQEALVNTLERKNLKKKSIQSVGQVRVKLLEPASSVPCR